jgi:glycosyltransferase involved in cell wall biosynthesis
MQPALRTWRVIRVSVIVPCFNSAAFLPDTVASIAAQTLRDLEVVFVDDGSTDDTVAIIEQLIARHRDRAMTLCVQPHAGVAAARNRAIAAARGAYVLPVDADDLIAPAMAETCAQILDTQPATSIVFTDREDFGESAGVFPAGRFELARLKYFNQIAYCSPFRRTVWEAGDGYRANVDGFDDWDFWIAAAARGVTGHHVAEPLLRHRRHHASYLNRLIADYELLYARIILNNREVYAASEVAAAAAYVTERRPAALLRSSKLIYTQRYPLLAARR